MEQAKKIISDGQKPKSSDIDYQVRTRLQARRDELFLVIFERIRFYSIKTWWSEIRNTNFSEYRSGRRQCFAESGCQSSTCWRGCHSWRTERIGETGNLVESNRRLVTLFGFLFRLWSIVWIRTTKILHWPIRTGWTSSRCLRRSNQFHANRSYLISPWIMWPFQPWTRKSRVNGQQPRQRPTIDSDNSSNRLASLASSKDYSLGAAKTSRSAQHEDGFFVKREKKHNKHEEGSILSLWKKNIS